MEKTTVITDYDPYFGGENQPLPPRQMHDEDICKSRDMLLTLLNYDVGYIVSHENKPDCWSAAGWHYVDDMRGERIYVIDREGRLVRPDDEIDQSGKFFAEAAKLEAWANIPRDWLVLSWALPSLSDGHQCGVIQQPASMSDKQWDRVQLIENQLTHEWDMKRERYMVNKSSLFSNPNWKLNR